MINTSTSRNVCPVASMVVSCGFFDVALSRYIVTPLIRVNWDDERSGYADPTLPIPARIQHYTIVYIVLCTYFSQRPSH